MLPHPWFSAAPVLISIALLTVPTPIGAVPPDAELENAIETSLAVDLATFLPDGALIVDNFCYQDSFLGCIGRVDITTSTVDPPTTGGISASVSSGASTAVDVDVLDPTYQLDVVAVTGIGFSCTATWSADALPLSGLFTVSDVPGGIDAVQTGATSASVVNAATDATPCAGFVGAIQPTMESVITTNLVTQLEPAAEAAFDAIDGDGNTPIAAAMESYSPPGVPALGLLGALVAFLALVASAAFRLR
ncbi:MAG: hypothetical protein AAF430_26635 [Myxococcota bacterium]